MGTHTTFKYDIKPPTMLLFNRPPSDKATRTMRLCFKRSMEQAGYPYALGGIEFVDITQGTLPTRHRRAVHPNTKGHAYIDYRSGWYLDIQS